MKPLFIGTPLRVLKSADAIPKACTLRVCGACDCSVLLTSQPDRDGLIRCSDCVGKMLGLDDAVNARAAQ